MLWDQLGIGVAFGTVEGGSYSGRVGGFGKSSAAFGTIEGGSYSGRVGRVGGFGKSSAAFGTVEGGSYSGRVGRWLEKTSCLLLFVLEGRLVW